MTISRNATVREVYNRNMNNVIGVFNLCAWWDFVFISKLYNVGRLPKGT
jgi:abortive infection bacteriophage resistance protein